jgi:regulator of protease activity HflC (stomatin/prohibitin superfamily)
MTMPIAATDPDLAISSFDDDLEELTPVSGLLGWFRRHALAFSVTTLLLLFGVVVCWPRIVITIQPGESGVFWSRIDGTSIDTVYGEGTHLIFPWNRMYIYDVRIAKVDHTVPVLSTEGLEMNVEVSVRYRPVAKSIPQLHQQIGPDYVERIILPEVITATREVMGRYRPEQLYALNTAEMQSQIVAKAAAQVRDRFVIVDDVLIRRIQLPDRVQSAIETKLQQEQAALEYEYRLARERQEKERKIIEADGIAEFANRVGGGKVFSESYLRWKGIEATLELAKSNNAKVIVMGSGKDGMPVILNPNQ